MFTCSSCGYEANPDSAPACSLCGTKRSGKAPPPKPEAAPKAASGGSSATQKKEEPPKKKEEPPKKKEEPPKKRDDALDDLASVAKAVADSATDEPVVTTKGARGAKAAVAAAGGKAVVTSQGVLRMATPPPEIENALTVVGTFVGALLGYVIEWHRLHQAPSSLGNLVIPAGVAIVFALLARFVLARVLDQRLTFQGKEALHGPIAAATGGFFAIFAIVGFICASRVASPSAVVQRQLGEAAVGASGDLLAKRIALLTPWTVNLKTEKFVTFSLKGKPDTRVSRAALTKSDVEAIAKTSGLALADLDRFCQPSPDSGPGAPLPAEFSVDAFTDHLATIFGVLSDKAREKDVRPATALLLYRPRKAGKDELLFLMPSPKLAGDLQSALPQGVPLWLGVALGIPRDSTPDHDALVAEVWDKVRPID
jgi:hypothetical protein